LKEHHARSASLPVSIVADRAIGLVVLLVFFDIACAIAYVLHRESSAIPGRLALAAGGLSIGCVVSVVAGKRWLLRVLDRHATRGGAAKGRLASLMIATSIYAERPGLLARAALISAAAHSATLLSYYFALNSLDIDAGLLVAGVLYPVVTVVVLIPASIAGIGVREATLIGLFRLFDLPATAAVALSWLSLITAVPTLIVGGLLQLHEVRRR